MSLLNPPIVLAIPYVNPAILKTTFAIYLEVKPFDSEESGMMMKPSRKDHQSTKST